MTRWGREGIEQEMAEQQAIEQAGRAALANQAAQVSPQQAAAPAVKQYSPIGLSQGTPLTQCPTNLDLTTPRGKALAMSAMSPAMLEFDRDGQCEIVACYYLVYPDTAVNPDTGEESEVTRVVLMDRDGRTFKTTSDSGPKRIAALMQLYDAAAWAAGIPMVVYQRRSARTGRTYHDIRPVVPPGD